MRSRILLASTLYGAATLAAAHRAELLGDADRSVLLVSNNAAVPETTPALDEAPGFAALRATFDAVYSWNEAIWPLHPGGWSPRPKDAPLWERHLRELWGVAEDEIELVVESIQVDPALALCRVFSEAPITVYADGLMSYGPTRNRLDALLGTRIRRLLHLDLVPGLRPLLLREFGVPSTLVPAETFRTVLDELAATAPDEVVHAPRGGALLLGQYLSALGLLDHAEEEELHLAMVRGAAQLGHRSVLFKPHPVAPLRSTDVLRDAAQALDVDLTVVQAPVLAETVYAHAQPALVAGCFSTGLFTAARYGIPAATVGTELLLRRLTPYENSNRIPLTLADALLPKLPTQAGAGFRAEGATVQGGSVQNAAAPAARCDETPVGPSTPTTVAPPALTSSAGTVPVAASGNPSLLAASGNPSLLAASGSEVAALVRAVGFAMRPRLHPDLRDEAERLLHIHRQDPAVLRYFDRRRLAFLGLPGALSPALTRLVRHPRVRRLARRAPRALRRAVTG